MNGVMPNPEFGFDSSLPIGTLAQMLRAGPDRSRLTANGTQVRDQGSSEQHQKNISIAIFFMCSTLADQYSPTDSLPSLPCRGNLL